MGAVYRARRLHLGDEVAIKVMQATPDAPPESRERFLRESRACAQLRHPNIVGLLDFGFDSANQPYMVMELLSGPSLREEIDLEAPMSPARVVGDPRAVAVGAAARPRSRHHPSRPQAGQHRRAPLRIGRARLQGDRLRPGAMKATSDETRLTDPAFFLGTLAYAAPEQMRGEDVTAAADVYALGVIAYEMLTGGASLRCRRPGDVDHAGADRRRRRAPRRAAAACRRRSTMR